MSAYDEAYDVYRDVLQQIAVHDPSRALRAAAERARATLSHADMAAVTDLAGGSVYEGRLLTARAHITVLEAA
ncbi:MAG TPA: hypothetical protein VIL88_02515 [Devosia sp.]|jgi:histone H3/H4|uniref:hypothetical protein n=1 Tax=Devosia sp. TaxID=1871048 RepID=UPI002F957DE8